MSTLDTSANASTRAGASPGRGTRSSAGSGSAAATRRGGGRDVGVDRAARPGALYALPAIILFAVFALVPLVMVVWLSFTSWNGLGTPQWSGLENWSKLFTDPGTWHSLRIVLLLTVLGWVVQTPLSLLIGVWAAGTQRNRAILSAIFFLPLLFSGAAIALVWKSLLDPNFGLANVFGPWFGVEDGNLIGTSTGALLCIVLVSTWQFVPFHTLLYQAATRGIPASLYEAATLDGATRVQQFRHITLPQLRNTLITSSTLMIVGSLTTFETILILTNGGPGVATQALPYRMYQQAFLSYDMGYGAALATVLVLLGTVLSLLIVRFSGYTKMRSTLEGI
ncbi:carbohydrate ABC transporter permease [Allostreptomyces psammosilenae]|uniref:Xylobiose transport system permease protein n=1 Tax=Allostreptomyces psammosilenae TaxID=1892865 RepID=A0A852ZWM3_9ACTN|nr:sugar ABC transporter permease [Allostreptomyces psammosilenae]NYI06375.1 xylobiose transport system permease protein [Allostreptomyces psammosilenae]